MMAIALIVVWVVTGLVNLIFGEIGRFSYFCVWGSLMLFLVKLAVM